MVGRHALHLFNVLCFAYYSATLSPAVMARRKRPMRLRSSPWTHWSLYVIILAALINATALIGFLLSFVQQAAYSGNTSRWNIVIIVALIAGVLATSLFLIIARIFAVRSVLRSIPKPYIPVKTIDVPKVSKHKARAPPLADRATPSGDRQLHTDGIHSHGTRRTSVATDSNQAGRMGPSE